MRCTELRHDTPFFILGKLKCFYMNGELENYNNFVIFLLAHRIRVIMFIRYVYNNIGTFRRKTRLSLVNAFTTFQEEAYKTYNLEHKLRDSRFKLLPREW